MSVTPNMPALISRLVQHKLLVVLLICVAARLVVFFAVPSVFRFEQTGAVHGSDAYDTYAQNLLRTGVYGRTNGVPDAVLAPLYSYVLAGIYATLGRSGLAV